MIRNQHLSILLVTIACVICPLFTGCNEPAESGTETAAKKELPKLYIHCPKDYKLSIARLREIHDVMTSENPLPDPIVCKIVEVIHGEGASAHSHYYPAEGDRQDDGHHHEEVKSSEAFHDVEIDVFTELRDVAWVLPNIAADSDIEEADWISLKKSAWKIVDLIDESVVEKPSADEKRAAYLEKQSDYEALIVELESLLESEQAPAETKSEKS